MIGTIIDTLVAPGCTSPRNRNGPRWTFLIHLSQLSDLLQQTLISSLTVGMADRTSHVYAPSDISAFDFEDISDERLRLDPSAYTTSTTDVPEDGVSEISEPTRSNSGSLTHEIDDFPKQRVAGPHATLKRSAVHEWFSTIFDAFMSLIPLFFLSMYIEDVRMYPVD
jgi:hypothetical protein